MKERILTLCRVEALVACFALLALVGFLGGCVVQSQPTAAPSPPTATPLPTAAPQSAPTETPTIVDTGAITLTLWYPEHMRPIPAQPGGAELKAIYQAFTDTYPDLGIAGEVKKARGPSGILDYLRVTAKVKPEALPDLVLLPLEDLSAAASLGILRPLDSVLLDQAVADLYPFAERIGSFEGERLAIPYELDIRVLVYDRQIVDAPPVDWSDWSQSLTIPVLYLLPLGEPDLAGADAMLLQYFAQGGTLQDDQGNIALSEVELARALGQYKVLHDRGVIHTASFTATNLVDTWDLFAHGQAAMAETSARQVLLEGHMVPGLACGTIPTADGNPVTLIEGWAWAVAAADPRREQGAMALLSWLMEEENLATRCAASSYLPARRSALGKSFGASDCADVFAELLEHAFPRPAEMCAAMQRWGQVAIQEVLTGVETPELAAAEVAARVAQLCQTKAPITE